MSADHVPPVPFRPSPLGTLGVELEWVTVDNDGGKQVPAAPALLSKTGKTPRIKAELFTSIIEINTDIHRQTQTCMDELQCLYAKVDTALEEQNASLLATGSHPFSHWQDQTVSDDPRYHHLVDRLQWVARRYNIFGIHVHIGMPDGDSCIHAMNRLIPVMSTFLAISANSPYWGGHDTGLSSCRTKISEGLSQGGMPYYFEDWQDFEHCAGRLMATHSIDSVRDIWWEMRPHPDFGTLEIRIGDMPATLEDTRAYIAYVRAETMSAAHRETVPRIHPSLIRENRWRACRYGMQASIIDPVGDKVVQVLDWLEARLDALAANGADSEDLTIVRDRLDTWRKFGDGAQRQRRLYSNHHDLSAMIHSMQEDGWS